MSDTDLATLHAQVQRLEASKTRLEADLHKERNEKKQLKSSIEDLQATSQQQLEAQGNFESLYKTEQRKVADLQAEIQRKDKRIEALSGVITESNSSMIEQIPEADRELIPEGLEPENLHKMLPRFVKRFSPPAAPDIGAGQGTGPEQIRTNGNKSKLTDAERLGYEMGNWESEDAYLEAMNRYEGFEITNAPNQGAE